MTKKYSQQILKLLHQIPNWLVFVGLCLVAAWYRVPRVAAPFWTDEFSSAHQALLFLNHGWGVLGLENTYLEFHNITTHLIIAGSFAVLGITELAARAPMIVLGSVVPGLVFLVGWQLTQRRLLGVLAGVLTVFSYQHILWSQQARGYPLQQVIILCSLLVYWQLVKTKKLGWLLVLLGLVGFGLLTHITFIFLVAALLLDTAFRFLQHQPSLKNLVGLAGLGAVFCLGILYISGAGAQITSFVSQLLTSGLSNNVWYYHSFMWREQALVFFLGAVGLLTLLRNQKIWPIVFFCGFYVFFLLFLFAPYTIRYLIILLPFLFIGMAVSLDVLVSQVSQQLNPNLFYPVVLIATGGLIIANGHFFTPKPKAYYSVNYFMREIAVLDYNQVYALINQTIETSDTPVAVVETWKDRAYWYLGLDYEHVFVYRWLDDEATTNGLPRATRVSGQTDLGLPKIFGAGELGLVASVDDIKLLEAEYPTGFIWIDDVTLPAEVQTYAAENFTKELELSRYSLDPNPLSSWPATLYSWGVQDATLSGELTEAEDD